MYLRKLVVQMYSDEYLPWRNGKILYKKKFVYTEISKQEEEGKTPLMIWFIKSQKRKINIHLIRHLIFPSVKTATEINVLKIQVLKY